ncbi:hypothetical protein [Cupriavidus sp. CuC1]|uniref:hypothetical protein n=1 Tax=Cupriavidus sp. CuC1 TaxID=3373131 RepID=UPI0037D52300
MLESVRLQQRAALAMALAVLARGGGGAGGFLQDPVSARLINVSMAAILVVLTVVALMR